MPLYRTVLQYTVANTYTAECMVEADNAESATAQAHAINNAGGASWRETGSETLEETRAMECSLATDDEIAENNQLTQAA